MMKRRSPYKRKSERGLTLVEVLVGVTVFLLIFLALAGSFRALLELIASSRAQSGAVGLANEKIEYLRAIQYDDVGTLGGIPAGLLPQTETKVLNGLTFTRRTLIQYIDAPEDGIGASDVNGIPADYKRVKVELSWTVRGVPHTYSLITNIVPRGIETIAGGGTLVVNVFDAAVFPVSGAAVRIVNAGTTPSIDVTANTNAQGIVMFPGAPAAANYEITVSKSGYSNAGTYSASAQNPNPSPAHVAVSEGVVSTMNFAIDRTSTLTFYTSGPPTTGSFLDTFSDSTKVATLVNAVVDSGDARLSGTPGFYEMGGEVYATATAPTTISSWGEARITYATSTDTSAEFRVYSVDASGTRTLLPDAVLPGNTAGFTESPIQLSSVATTTYPRLALGAELASDGLLTPTIDAWEITHAISHPPIGNVAIAIEGEKSIGTNAGTPIPKRSETVTTNAAGVRTLTDLEWDIYTVNVPTASGYDVSEACDAVPIVISPDTARTVRLTLVPHTTHSLKVSVTNSALAPISGASVRLVRGAYDETEVASACGQAFFGGLTTADDYTLEVSAPGYASETVEDISVAGYGVRSVQLD